MVRTYTVVKGDTLSALAERFYGDETLVPVIAAANRIADPDQISVGQVLTIPDVDPTPSIPFGTLPYASEHFGIYQPLLGWKSRITEQRFQRARDEIYDTTIAAALDRRSTGPGVAIQVREAVSAKLLQTSRDVHFEVSNLEPVNFDDISRLSIDTSIDSGVARLLSERLDPQAPPQPWSDLITAGSMTEHLRELQQLMNRPTKLNAHPQLGPYVDEFREVLIGSVEPVELLKAFFDKETKVAGYLVFLARTNPDKLTTLLYNSADIQASRLAVATDPLLSFGDGNWDAILSPIGVIHLYRQYFFEFASFLGPPVGHIWLSPGATTELIEVNTRRRLTEQTVETQLETNIRTESQEIRRDDIADAVKDENKSNTKFGVTNTMTYRVPVFQDTATASFSLDNASSQARETTHKQMREQTEQLASEIKKNFKTTFRTVTEVTDTTSKRYVLANNTPRLVNYELRRKMRKVGVQVQDIGVQLCWHTFVDDAGKDLGLGQLVHSGEPPDLSGLMHPEQPPSLDSKTIDVPLRIPFQPIDSGAPKDETYVNGGEASITSFLGREEVKSHIVDDFPSSVTYPTPGYTLASVTVIGAQGADVTPSVLDVQKQEGSSTGSFTVHLDRVNFRDRDEVLITASVTWEPSQGLLEIQDTAYKKAMGAYNVEKKRLYVEAFIKASRERIKVASNIKPRTEEDLREEERTVIYRRLIRQLMSVGLQQNLSAHVSSELVRSIFDVDKMLYFAAPEWWVPRLHRSTPGLGTAPPTPASGAARPPSGASQTGNAIGKLERSQLLLESLLGQGLSMQPKLVGPLLEAATDELYGETKKPPRTKIPAENVVDWGGGDSLLRDNYYITEDSAPARLGSSLGWLMQLDGDDLRNALLNSPWVKAVIPIRPGKERAAINWLRQAHVEGSEGLDAQYIATDDDPSELHSTPKHKVTVEDALEHLIDKIAAFERNSRTPIVGNPAEPDNPANQYIGSLPTEAVFEHGYFPLKDGIQFGGDSTEQTVFSQWMEVLPTDQIAALEVEYDPTTLAVKVSEQPPPNPNPWGNP